MKNITNLTCWPALVALGFERINYNWGGRLVKVGASLRSPSGSDIITIEPSTGKYYHISGGVPGLWARCEFVNNHFTGRQILNQIKKML